ncbi:putative protein kinase [Leptomonas seymouri]|uniref:Protein kinase domain-containing protein n=1 Tax=Leptomonas seymouri TaxID=5684 RepID=A0A0N1IKN2_LEPSE|nr:putative protein kinase [Leptomonas seymouri]|eukprot:KPI86995.1 putative protein kinase [Leptomonas seymouri]
MPSKAEQLRPAKSSPGSSCRQTPGETHLHHKGNARQPPSPFPSTASFLYALLLRTGATRGSTEREAAEHASHSCFASLGHTPRASLELETPTNEVLYAEVRKMFPYWGVLSDVAAGDAGLPPSSSTMLPIDSHTGRETTPTKNGALPVKQWRASLAKLSRCGDCTEAGSSLPASQPTVPSPSPSSSRAETTGSPKRRKLPASTVVIKKKPPRKIAAAEAAAAAAASTQGAPASAPQQSDPASALKPPLDYENSRTAGKRSVRVLTNSQVPAAFAQFKILLEDFTAAVEQCRVALEEQRSSSVAAWEVAKPEDDASELLADEEAALSHLHMPRWSPGPRLRGSNTVLVADLPPRSPSAQLMTETVSLNSMTEALRADHGSGNNNGYLPQAGGTIGSESPRDMGDHGVGGLETADLPKGIVAIAYTIAEHLHALFHPTVTPAELEKEVATLEVLADGAAHQSAPSQARRARAVAAHEEIRSVNSASRTSYSAPPLTWLHSGRKVPTREAEVSAELREFKAAVHNYIWGRITSLVSSISLSSALNNHDAAAGTAEGRAAGRAAGTEEERQAQAYVQLPFLIWLYTASGLAADAVRGLEEAKTKAGAASTSPPLTLSDLLPTVDTLARQLLRRQYERVQPTAETLLTANTFLASVGVNMTDKTFTERLFPLQSGTTVNDVLAFSTLQSTASLLGPDNNDFVEVSTATTSTNNLFATVASTATVSEVPFSVEEPILGPSTVAAGRGSFMARVESGAKVGGSPMRRVPAHVKTSTALPPSGVETQRSCDHSVSVSSVEMYVNWLRGKEEAAEGVAKNDPGDVPHPRMTEGDACTSKGLPAAHPHGGGLAAEGGGDAGAGEKSHLVSAAAESTSSRSSSGDRSMGSSVTQGRDEDFRLSSVMPSTNLPPCLARVEQELHQARGALQFARKLGTLYATQDMNTLLPLLPTLAKEERRLSLANPLSARMEASSGGLRSSFDSRAASGSPRTFVGSSGPSVLSGNRVLPPSMASPPNIANTMVQPGGLPPFIVSPLIPSERHTGAPAMLTSRRMTSNASTATLFPPTTPPSMDDESLMTHLNTCAAAMASLNDQFFVSRARALEVAFSLSMMLLSHVMGEVLNSGARAASEPRDADATKKAKSGVSSAVIKTPPFAISTSGAAAAPPKVAGASAATLKAAARQLVSEPKLRSLSVDLAHLFGFGKGHLCYQQYSLLIRDTLISAALSALQQKDVINTQVLLQYIALDTVMSQHYAQLQARRLPATAFSSIKLADGSQRCEAAAASSASVHETRKGTKARPRPVGPWMALLQDNSSSFVNVWFSSFAHLVDTTRHLLKGDHSTPSSLKDAVWHLAGLAQYFLLTRARGYDVFGGRVHLSAASKPARVDDFSTVLSLLSYNRDGVRGSGAAAADVVANSALQYFITSQLVEPTERILGVLVSFMESIAEVLTADMESGAAMERQQREGVMFADMMSEDEGAAVCLVGENSEYLGSACDSPSQLSSEAGANGGCLGAACSSAANRSETQEAQACWMELAVHYFLEIVDVLLDVSLYLPEKPLIIYQLTVSASRMPSFSSNFLDAVMVGAAGTRSPPASATEYHLPAAVTASEDGAGGSALERLQIFLSRYTSLVLQSAVTRFTVEGMSMPTWMAAAHSSPNNTSATYGVGEEAAPRTLMSSLLTSVAASLAPVGLEEIALSSARPSAGQQPQPQPQQQQQPSSTPRSTGVPVSSRAEAFSIPLGSPSATRSTMWWPKARFQRYSHLIRVLEHAQLLCLCLNTPYRDDFTPSPPILSIMERAGNAARRDAAPCLRVSAVTALLNTSTGPCAQLLSVPYSCPPLTVEASSYMATSMPTSSRERQIFHSPMEQPQGRYYGAVSGSALHQLVLSDRVLREVCGGLWIRVEVLQLLRFAAAPLDTDCFATFTKAAGDISRRVGEKSMQSHYKAVAAMKADAETVLPKAYASTYVRLLFLRYVQAFYADIRAIGAKGHAAGGGLANVAVSCVPRTQDHALADRTETSAATSAYHIGSNNYRPPCAIHVDPNNGETTTRSVVSPRASASHSSPLQDLSRRLWTQYCYQLLWALRDLCWNSTEAHETANNLSIASVYGRLLQMIGGRPSQEECEGELEGTSEWGDSFFDEPQFNRGEVDLTTIITLGLSPLPRNTTLNGKPEGFADFESVSNDSEAPRVQTTSPLPPALQTRKPSAPFGASCRDGQATEPTLSSMSITQPPGAYPSTSDPSQVSVNVDDLTTLKSLELNRHNEKGSHHSNSRCGDSARVNANSSSAAAAAPSPPVLPQLELTGLKPPLYFASSGDTAAAQEDNYFKKQSKQLQKEEDLEERQRNNANASVVNTNSGTSDADEGEDEFEEEGLEDFELSSASPKSSPLNVSLMTEQQGHLQVAKCSRCDNSDSLPKGGFAAADTVPKPLGLTIPKLSLGNLGPPLYFTSAGDTGVFAEVAAGSPAQSSPQVVPAQKINADNSTRKDDGASRPTKHVDPAGRSALRGNTKKYQAEKLKAASPPPPPPPTPPTLSPPVLPSVTTKTVEGFALPKLQISSLGPPMYFTSSGDTGGFVEAQNAKDSAVKAPTVERATPAVVFGRSDSQSSTNTARFRSGVVARGAPPLTSSPENGSAAAMAAAAGDFRDFSASESSDAASSCSVLSSGACVAVHKDEGGGCHDAGSRGVLDTQPGNDSSLVLSVVPESDEARRWCMRKKVTRRSPRLSVTPVVPPVVTMELVLSLCSIILQRDSGMIQYRYTVSSLTQKRVLPGVSASQRWRLNSGSNVAASKASNLLPSKPVFFGGGMETCQDDHWRYTPQHSPSSFHVIQSLHNYLKDARNTFVVDLLEEWMLGEYAAMERARMEEFEAEYALQAHSGRARTLPLSPSSCSNFNTTMSEATERHTSAISMGRFVLLRLLLPRAITHLVIPPSERRIGAGGYGSVTSGTVHALSQAAAVLPANWGRRGCHWRPATDAKKSSGAARGASSPSALGSKSPLPPERAMCDALDNLRTPWRVAVYRTAQAVCGCDVAIKHLSLSAQGSESGNLPVCHAEVLAMYRLRGHPHIVPLLSFDNNKDEYVLIMPNYTLGSFRVWRQTHYQLGYVVLSLSSKVHEPHKEGLIRQRPLSSPTLSSSLFATCARSLLQVLEAVVFMHEHHIRHGDIKCDNVLIDKADLNKGAKLDPPCLPLSVRLCDFGSCDTCSDDDIRNLKNDIMAGAARFMAGRWGVGRGTEAIQPPEVMSAKRRYTLFHRIMTTPSSAGAPSVLPAPQDRTERGSYGTSALTPSLDQLGRTRAFESMEAEERAMTERLRRAELSVDIWACGCLLYEMLTGCMLFGEARLGRLLVLAAADDDAEQEQASGWRPSGSAVPRPIAKVAVPNTDDAPQMHHAAVPSTSSTRHALDEWERRDLESAVGAEVVRFMSRLLDLDPLQRPSAAEALYHWKEILINMGFEV